MQPTSPSLLEKLRHPADHQAWQEFVELYTPLLFQWGRRLGLQGHDAADLVQDVFTALFQKLPEFHYDRQRSFRAWLHAVTLNQWRDNCKRRGRQSLAGNDGALNNLAAADDFEAASEDEYRRSLVSRALQLMQVHFEPATWRACWHTVVEGRTPAEVARALGLSEGAVYVAKWRVLRRLRQELQGMLD